MTEFRQVTVAAGVRSRGSAIGKTPACSRYRCRCLCTLGSIDAARLPSASPGPVRPRVLARHEADGPFTEPDPAERSAFNRLFYRNRRPTWFGHWVSQFFCWWARIGLPPRSWVALEVRDRVSGRMRADAVVIPTVAGRRYIVSMFGTISDWVHNLEAAHGEAVIAHGGSQRVRLVPVPPEERAPVLQEYVRVASSGRKHFPLPVGAPLGDFAAIAAQYPVYRIEVSTA